MSAGCSEVKHIEDYQQSHNQFGQILIGETEVILTSKHLASIKSELYQPSLFLYGTTVPVNKTTIQLPEKIQVQQLFVTKGQKVEEDQSLFSYVVVPEAKIQNNTITALQTPASKKPEPSQIPEKSKAPEVSQSSEVLQNSEVLQTSDASQTPEPEEGSQPLQTSPQEQVVSSEESRQDSSQDMLETQELTEVVADIVEETPVVQAKVVTVTAPFSGTVTQIFQTDSRAKFPSENARIFVNEKPVMTLQTMDDFHFTSTLLLTEDTKSEIILGQHVNFITRINGEYITLSGQIIDISPDELGEFVIVNVHILPDEKRTQKLEEGLIVQGKVDHGQLAVGTLVAEAGVHQEEGYDLSVFSQPHAEVAAPVQAYVWTVDQDRRLNRISAKVVSHHPETHQYLVSGIPSDSLIVLVDLPKSAEGKLLKIA